MIRPLHLKGVIFALSSLFCFSGFSQTATFVPPGNQVYAGLEKNILFNAPNRYTVNQIGSRHFNLGNLFNGSYAVEYIAGFDGTEANAVTIEISGLPNWHVQLGAYVGFSTRGIPAKRFKIEGYNVYSNPATWVTLADETNNSGNYYSKFVTGGSFTTIKFTFYESVESQGYYAGWIGLSELFFLHGEVGKAYDGLLVQYNESGNVGIGTTAPTEKLSVKGKIRAQEVKVEGPSAPWPDYVFEDNYKPTSLQETEQFIRIHKHLPEIPSAKEVEENGISLGEMNAKLLKKIEELTLHMIDLQKENREQNRRIEVLQKKIK